MRDRGPRVVYSFVFSVTLLYVLLEIVYTGYEKENVLWLGSLWFEALILLIFSSLFIRIYATGKNSPTDLKLREATTKTANSANRTPFT